MSSRIEEISHRECEDFGFVTQIFVRQSVFPSRGTGCYIHSWLLNMSDFPNLAISHSCCEASLMTPWRIIRWVVNQIRLRKGVTPLGNETHGENRMRAPRACISQFEFLERIHEENDENDRKKGGALRLDTVRIYDEAYAWKRKARRI